MVTPLAQQLSDLDIPFVVTSVFDDLAEVGGELFAGVVCIPKRFEVEELYKALLNLIEASDV